jgi:hypothetical protein
VSALDRELTAVATRPISIFTTPDKREALLEVRRQRTRL